MVDEGKQLLKKRFKPNSYNVGSPAGQTVMHCQIHLIPRRSGDSVNPRGGVRGMIAGKPDPAAFPLDRLFYIEKSSPKPFNSAHSEDFSTRINKLPWFDPEPQA